MAIAYDFDLDVHYGFVWLAEPGSGGEMPDLVQARGGQRNGICGAAVEGVLSMLTGLHTGTVPFRVEVWNEPPPLEDAWEDVVEVSFQAEDADLVLSAFQDAEPVSLPAAGSYRARYCASGMDQAREQDTRLDEHLVTDRYLLALWPAAPAAELIVRQRSEFAAYWAGVAQEAPPPPPPPTAAELAAAEEEAEHQRLLAAQRQREQLERMAWRGVQPTPAMRAVGPRIATLAEHDYALADLVANAEPTVARQIALWAAQHACDLAAAAPIDWTPALKALAHSTPMPAPFDNSRDLFATLYPSKEGTRYAARVERHTSTQPPPHHAIHPPAAAAATLRAAQGPEPSLAAVEALHQAAAAYADPKSFYDAAHAKWLDTSN